MASSIMWRMTEMNDAVINNPEFFSLASQLYVRMRRYGRVVDAVYMAKNHEYAREILQLAGREADVEILKIVVRFEALLAQEYPIVKEPIPTKAVESESKVKVTAEKEDVFSMTLRPFRKKQPTLPEIPVLSSVVEHTGEIEEEVAHHYVGALR
jgi:hypothetical protein